MTRTVVIGAVAASLAIGCGSTVQQVAVGDGTASPSAAVPASAPPGFVAEADDARPAGHAAHTPQPAISPQVGAPGRPPAPGAPAAGAPPAPAAPAPGVEPVAPPPPPGPAPAPPDTRPVAPGVPGVDASTITVGLTYSESTSQANQALGAEGMTGGDPRRNYETLIAYYNEHGGAAGRQIVPVYYVWDVASAQPNSAQEQAACAAFTQDNPVFVSLASGVIGLTDGTFVACVHAAGTPVLASPGLSGTDDATFAELTNFAETNTLSLDTIARLWPRALDEAGYFDATDAATPTRVGLLTYDDPRMRRATDAALKPAMAAAGREFASEVYLTPPDRLADVSGMSAEVQNAILTFRSAGVDHVMIQDFGNALMSFVFMNSADGQGYRPRYGLTSNNGGQALAGLVPPEQLSGALMIGWNPHLDVPPGEFTESLGGGRTQCDAVYQEAGITFADVNAATIGYAACDEITSLIAAVNAGSGPLAQDTLISEFVSIGTAFESALLGPTRVGPDRHYGVTRTRPAAFNDECTCFRYTGDWRDVT